MGKEEESGEDNTCKRREWGRQPMQEMRRASDAEILYPVLIHSGWYGVEPLD